MRLILFIVVTIFYTNTAIAQKDVFPKSWVGNWKGELQWYKTGKPEPQKVVMELRIHPAASGHQYTWQIIYGSVTDDNRPYLLIPKDSAGIHWAIDEQNGIILDQYWVAGKFCGAFTVMNNTLLNSYWMEGDKLMIEFYSMGAKPIVTTGKGTNESPVVDSYKMGSYQKAILLRQ